MIDKYLLNDTVEHSLTDYIRVLITGTKRYIKISSFLMQDASISKMLMELASSGKAAVFLISNKRDQESEEYKESTILPLPQNGIEKTVGFDNHGKFLKELYYSGVHVRLLDNLHAKFVISDGDKGVIMSANLAPNSLYRNIETGLVINGFDTKELEYVFDTMYNHADIVRFQGASRNDITVKVDNKLDPKSIACIGGNIRLTVASSTPTNLDLCKVHSIYDAIIDIIKDAREYVYITSWHFRIEKKDSLREFINSIHDARRRGVAIYLYSNINTQCPSLQDSLMALKKLEKLGCISYGDDKNHSKCVLSESKGILFTANIDDKHGMTDGFEVGCMMNENQRKMAENHINNLINGK